MAEVQRSTNLLVSCTQLHATRALAGWGQRCWPLLTWVVTGSRPASVHSAVCTMRQCCVYALLTRSTSAASSLAATSGTITPW